MILQLRDTNEYRSYLDTRTADVILTGTMTLVSMATCTTTK